MVRRAGYAASIDRAAGCARGIPSREPQRLDEFAFARRAGEELSRTRIEELADRLDVTARYQHQQCGTVGGDQPAQPARRRQSVVERTARIDQRDRGTASQEPAFLPFGLAHARRLPARTGACACQNLRDLITLTERYREQRRCDLHVFHIRRTPLDRCEPSRGIAARQCNPSRSGLVSGTVRS